CWRRSRRSTSDPWPWSGRTRWRRAWRSSPKATPAGGSTRMATRKSRTDAVAAPAATEKKKPGRARATTRPAAPGKPAANAADGPAKPAKPARPPSRRGEIAAGNQTARARAAGGRAPATAADPVVDEAEIEASLAGKANGKNLVVVESPTKSKTL